MAAEFGIDLPRALANLNWRRVRARKRAILQRRSEAAIHKVGQFSTLQLLFGQARLRGPRKAFIKLFDGDSVKITFEQCILATGRSPRVQGLGLEHTAVKVSPHGVEVDQTLQTAEPGIYAVGDVLGQPMFAHWATAQCLALARHLLGLPGPFPKREHNTAAIFSAPELAMAGLTEPANRPSPAKWHQESSQPKRSIRSRPRADVAPPK